MLVAKLPHEMEVQHKNSAIFTTLNRSSSTIKTEEKLKLRVLKKIIYLQGW